MFAISPDSVDLNYERSRKSVLTWKQKQGLFSFFQVLGKHQQAMPIYSKLRHRLYLQNTKTYK